MIKNRDITFPALSVLLCVTLVIVTSLIRMEVFGEDPSSHIVQSTVSFCQTGTFISQGDLDKHEEYRRYSIEHPGVYWQDRFALSAHNELLPLHAAMVRILLAPFVCSLNTFGVRIAMGLSLFLVLFGSWIVLCKSAPVRSEGKLFFISIVLGTQVLLTGTALNYDLFLSACLLMGIGLSLERSALFGGAFLGLSLLTRPSTLLFLPFVFAGLFSRNLSRAALIDWCIGVGSFVVLMACIQWYYFGSPLVTFYQTMPLYDRGVVIWNPHPAEISISELMKDWELKLFDRRVGLLIWNPALFIAIPLMLVYSRKMTTFDWMLILGGVLQALIVFARDAWRFSYVGNRYLMGYSILVVTLVFSAWIRNRNRVQI